MELTLNRKEIEQILLVHVTRLMPEAGLNTIEWAGYRLPGDATFKHSDLPPETDDE